MYSPKIREDLINQMYQIKHWTGKPMTRQANEAIEEYVQRMKKEINSRGKRKEVE